MSSRLAVTDAEQGGTPMMFARTLLPASLAARCVRGGVIANYHRISAAQLATHVATLSRWFDFISIDELPSRMRYPGRRPFCLLTFDDGKKSNATEAAPVLARLGIPAVFYLTTAAVDKGVPLWFDRYALLASSVDHLPREYSTCTLKLLPHALRAERLRAAFDRYGLSLSDVPEQRTPMTWDDARRLYDQGFTIGAHGRHHCILTRESPLVATEEIAGSLSDVSEAIGTPCHTFAFPNGNHSPELAQFAVACGARTVVTTDPAWVRPTDCLWRLPRVQLFAAYSPAEIAWKVGFSALGFVISNPDGTGRRYALWRRRWNAYPGALSNVERLSRDEAVSQTPGKAE